MHPKLSALSALEGNARLRRLTQAALCAAVAVALSGFSFPVGPSRCYPVQHAMNAVAGVLLGPWYACAAALVAATVRNLMGTGTLLAYPGSVFGALAVGCAARLLPERHRALAAFAEPLATATVGAWAASHIAGNPALYPMLAWAFLTSAGPGAAIGLFALRALRMRRADKTTPQER
ncbi:energy coupling factor transporter S component ThiW [Synergistaceae bacterium OttesenSCG-928-I11]|nr:energy coupling factor transporter S component ThiW [Synergistaceae bacterium OttesenSCG-928-I11]